MFNPLDVMTPESIGAWAIKTRPMDYVWESGEVHHDLWYDIIDTFGFPYWIQRYGTLFGLHDTLKDARTTENFCTKIGLNTAWINVAYIQVAHLRVSICYGYSEHILARAKYNNVLTDPNDLSAPSHLHEPIYDELPNTPHSVYTALFLNAIRLPQFLYV